MGWDPENMEPIAFFMMFLPRDHLEDCLQVINRAATDSGERNCPPFQLGELLQFMGFIVHASKFPDTSHEERMGMQRSWKASSMHFWTLTQIPGFVIFPRLRQWKRFLRIHTSSNMEETMPNNTDIVNQWLKASTTSKWQLKFSPGFVITIDETMWSWSGPCGDLHLTYLPRKPKPLGWMLKTTCCAISLEFASIPNST